LNTNAPDPSRFAQLATALATQAHQEIAPHIPLNRINDWAVTALERSVRQYRPRQGATLRTYLTYKILAGIYDALRGAPWPSIQDEKRYRFAKKSNELMLHFATSAEATVKRSVRLEEEEMVHLLRLLVVTGLIIYKDVPKGGIQEAWTRALASLNEQQRRFLSEYYDRDSTLEDAAQMTSAEAFRFHWAILESLDAQIAKVGA
jgi:DNA-directed RNA polymerase specialized sigma subunit